MPITTHAATNFGRLLRLIITGAEGAAFLTPHNVGDGTITFGYGYTFIRGGQPYGTLDEDLATLEIALSATERGLIGCLELGSDQAKLLLCKEKWLVYGVF